MTRRYRRRGAVAVEAAVVYPVLFLLLLGVIVGGMGVFRYELVACMACEGSRYAAVRGGDWQRESGQPAPTATQITSDVIVPMAVSMDPANLTVRVECVNGVTGAVTDWDASDKSPTSLNAAGDPVANRVRVTVSYRWSPEWFFGGPIDLRSVSESPASY